MLDTSTLVKFTNRYDASKVFAKGKKIYYYFNAKDKNDNTYKYYLFNPAFNFTKNFELLQKKFEDISGYWHLYTDNVKYPTPKLKNNNQIQLELL